MCACLVMGLGGFLAFGDRTLGNVLNNLASDNAMVNVARLFFGLNMLTTLPLEAFVCREVMLTYWWPDDDFDMRRHLVLSTGLVAGATAISLLTCDLGVVFELVGATSAVAIAYILPPMCYIKLARPSWRTHLAHGVVAFGVVVMIISVVQAVGKMMHGMSWPPPPFFFSFFSVCARLAHLCRSLTRTPRPRLGGGDGVRLRTSRGAAAHGAVWRPWLGGGAGRRAAQRRVVRGHDGVGLERLPPGDAVGRPDRTGARGLAQHEAARGAERSCKRRRSGWRMGGRGTALRDQ